MLLAVAPSAASSSVPTTLAGVDGTAVDVASLASTQRVFFVTLKATWCPVCQVQLRRMTALLPRLRSCGATFVVLAPGPRADLLRIAKETAFPFPFVEDVGLSVARGATLQLAPDQIEPAIFEVDRRGEIVWMQRGRADGAFGDAALLERLDCGELKTAASRPPSLSS
jgi:peroxiredoxin